MNYESGERIAMDELRKRMKGILEEELYEDDNVFYRFLKARDFNVDNAEIMLKEYIELRKQYDIKNLSTFKHPEVLEKYIPFNRLGHDKDGNVVQYVSAGNIDWIGLYSSAKYEDIAKRLIHYTEDDIKYLKKYSEETGKHPHQILYILSMTNLSFATATHKKVVVNCVSLLQLYQIIFPERMKAIYFINASSYFAFVYAVMKKFLPTTVINKLKVYADDSWKEEILKIIDPEILPGFLGGTKTDPDGNPLCLTFIKHGGPVPEKYYTHRSKRSLANMPDVQRITLGRANFREVFLEVKEPDSFLEWEFETKSRDVGFGIFHEDSEGNKTEIIPIQRINTDEFAETGLFKCENVGRYIVVFDNTYSLLRKKDIFYKIKVVKSTEEMPDPE